MIMNLYVMKFTYLVRDQLKKGFNCGMIEEVNAVEGALSFYEDGILFYI